MVLLPALVTGTWDLGLDSSKFEFAWNCRQGLRCDAWPIRVEYVKCTRYEYQVTLR